MTRAKFECTSVKETTWAKEYEFSPVMKGDPGDNPENEEFFKTTPTVKITIVVKNENVKFVPGQSYYIDFTLADQKE